VLAMMTCVNAMIESWVRARPEQWPWLHRRWPNLTPAGADLTRLAGRGRLYERSQVAALFSSQ